LDNTTENILIPEKWVENYGDLLYNYTISRVSKSELAEDLVQDCLLSAYKSKDGFKGGSSVKTWLIYILKRKITDYYRSAEYKHNKVSFEDYHSRFDSPFEEEGDMPGQWKTTRAPQDWQVTDKEHLNTEFLRSLQNCIGHLPEKTASVFVLKNMEEVSSDEICKELSISPSNLWVILHRARLQLRECLEKFGFTK